MIFQEASNTDVTAHVKQLILPIPSSIVVKMMLLIVSIVRYLSPKTDVTYWVHFFNGLYHVWHNMMEKEKKHSENTYRQEAVNLPLATIDRFEKVESLIPALTDNFIKER